MQVILKSSIFIPRFLRTITPLCNFIRSSRWDPSTPANTMRWFTESLRRRSFSNSLWSSMTFSTVFISSWKTNRSPVTPSCLSILNTTLNSKNIALKEVFLDLSPLEEAKVAVTSSINRRGVWISAIMRWIITTCWTIRRISAEMRSYSLKCTI